MGRVWRLSAASETRESSAEASRWKDSTSCKRSWRGEGHLGLRDIPTARLHFADSEITESRLFNLEILTQIHVCLPARGLPQAPCMVGCSLVSGNLSDPQRPMTGHPRTWVRRGGGGGGGGGR